MAASSGIQPFARRYVELENEEGPRPGLGQADGALRLRSAATMRRSAVDADVADFAEWAGDC